MKLTIDIPDELFADVLLAFGDGTTGSTEKLTTKVLHFIAGTVARKRAHEAASAAAVAATKDVEAAFGVQLPTQAIPRPSPRG